MTRIVLISLLISLLYACDHATNKEPVSEVPQTREDSLLNATIEAHGGEAYEQSAYTFTFRDRKYSFVNEGPSYRYEAKYEKNDTFFEDYMDNEKFSRKVNGEAAALTEKKETSGREGLNSVIYFATLPHKLKDPAVNKFYEGEVIIKDQAYHVIRVTFDEEGGGLDHEDNYYYWINKGSNFIDYLAYNYQVNGGGVRFREGYNKRKLGGIVFQDYVNYKAPLGTPLAELPSLFEAGKLEKLSEINTEDVKLLSTQE
ncbi:DUF6503 family protein [Portibacter marinus]|uniref:DUF6503 family protein n=1 Tax=Portibacter marinus TaxID=2898660 RepID=UPI001F1DF961|nr:DUF6503 family protein [Portibacter marinus]